MAGLLPFEFPLENNHPSPMEISLELDFPTPPRSATSSPSQPPPRPRQIRRSMVPLVACRNLPQTSMEWQRLLGYVKRDYQNGKYRACLFRCNEVLDNIRQLVRSESVPSTMLHLLTDRSRLICKPRISYTFTSMQHVPSRCSFAVFRTPYIAPRCSSKPVTTSPAPLHL